MEAIAAGRPGAARRSRPRWLARVAGGLGAFLVATGALVAGVGVLYLTRGSGALAIGPRVPGALPLEQLARQDSQPLLHMAIAWLPAGFAAGLALGSLTRMGPRARLLSLTLPAGIVLLLTGALSDAIAVNEALSPHLAPQLTRAGTWVAVALFGIGAACSGMAKPRGPTRR